MDSPGQTKPGEEHSAAWPCQLGQPREQEFEFGRQHYPLQIINCERDISVIKCWLMLFDALFIYQSSPRNFRGQNLRPLQRVHPLPSNNPAPGIRRFVLPTAIMPPDRPGVRSSRKRPVSCHFCRSRKLRCSRRFPCPNCTSRGIACELYASQPADPQPESVVGDAGPNNLDILARLQRLEDIVLGKHKDVSPEPAERTPAQSQSPRREQHATEDARRLEVECSIQGLSVRQAQTY